MATVNKNFKVKDGLVVEGTTGTIAGSDILTAQAISGGTQDNITVTYNANSKTLDFAVTGIDIDTNGPITFNNGVLDIATGEGLAVENQALVVDYGNGLTSQAGSLVVDFDVAASKSYVDGLTTDDISEGSTNLYYNDARARAALSAGDGISYSNGLISVSAATLGGITVGNGSVEIDRNIVDGWYDANGSAANAITTAEGYTDTKIGNTYGKTVVEWVGQNFDALGAAANAQTAAQEYTDSRINDGVTSNLKTWSSTKISSEITSAVDGLVDGAPGLLDTLNEIAAAINDDENYATTLTTALAGKQANLNAGAAISSADLANNIVSVIYDFGLDRDNNGKLIVSNAIATANALTEGLSGKQDTLVVGPGIEIGGTTGTVISTKVDGLTIVDNAGTSEDTLAVPLGYGLAVGSLGVAVDTDTIASVDYVDTNFVNVADLPGQLDDYIPLTDKGANDGVATLNSSGDVPTAQLGNVADALKITNSSSIVDGTSYILSGGAYFAQGSNGTIAGQKKWTTATIETSSGQTSNLSFMGVSNKLTVSAVDTSGAVHTEEVLIAVDGDNNVNIVQYAIVTTGSDLFEIFVESVSSPWSNANKLVSVRFKRPNSATSGNKISITVGVEGLWYYNV